MDKQLIELIQTLGLEGIQAFYIYLFIDYLTLWVFLGLIAWGVRAVWNKLKEDM